MQRETTKHGPRLDEQLKRAEARSSDQAGDETSGKTNQTRATGPADRERPAPAALSPSERDLRSAIAKALPLSKFPGDPGSLSRAARERSAPGDVIAILSSLPEQTYDTVEQIWEAAGGIRESRF